MSTPDTNNIGIKLQAAGENLNTWGDPNLNNDLIVLSNLASKWKALTINGDYTVSETNYATTNDTEVATIKLVAGTVTAAFNLVLPGRPKRLLVWNASGYTATPKLAATSGFSLPNNRVALIATDGSTDVYNMTPNYGGLASPSNNLDIPSWSAVQTAIATAGLPATAGTVLNSGTDTTAGYLSQKVTTAIGTATTTQLGTLLSVALSTDSPGAAEKLKVTISAPYVGGFVDGGPKTSEFTPLAGYAYDVDCTSATVTVNLGGMTSPQLGQEIKLNNFGNFPMYLKGTVNGIANLTVTTQSNQPYRYCGSSWGWN